MKVQREPANSSHHGRMRLLTLRAVAAVVASQLVGVSSLQAPSSLVRAPRCHRGCFTAQRPRTTHNRHNGPNYGFSGGRGRGRPDCHAAPTMVAAGGTVGRGLLGVLGVGVAAFAAKSLSFGKGLQALLSYKLQLWLTQGTLSKVRERGTG